MLKILIHVHVNNEREMDRGLQFRCSTFILEYFY